MSTNILLLCGGDGSEHSISLISADYVESQLKSIEGFNVLKAIVHNHGFEVEGKRGYFTDNQIFCYAQNSFRVDCVVPVIHGIPGETGEIQALLDIHNIPFIGCGSEASRYCFNKITTKLYLTALDIPNTPYLVVPVKQDRYRKAAEEFFDKYQDIYVKAASQGSSVGCYHITNREKLWDAICQAFEYSSEVLLEKTIVHRELEVAAYEYNGKVITTSPGEIIIPENKFYSYEEKYSKDSGTTTTVTPQGLSRDDLLTIDRYAQRAFIGLKLRHLSRIDFFLSKEDGIMINEINTFPGMTPISMFPKLLENNGDSMKEFLRQCVLSAIEEKHSSY